MAYSDYIHLFALEEQKLFKKDDEATKEKNRIIAVN